MKHWVRVLGVAMVAALALIVAEPAAASPASGYVSGVNTPLDDWGDEGPIDQDTRSHNNVVALWQQILWAEDLLETSDIDCDFGPKTAAATRNFQSRYGLDIDGSAGPQTWGYADSFLYVTGTSGGTTYLEYSGYIAYPDFRRLSNGRWQFQKGGAWRDASYTSSSAC